MRRRVALIAAFAIAPAAIAAFFTAAQPARPATGTRVAILAYHDSRLLTLCPVFGKEVVRSDILTNRMKAKVAVGAGYAQQQNISINLDPERQTMVFLPLPASAGTTGELDRLAADVSVEERLAAEFLARGIYTVVSSPSEADVVFIVESHYLAMLLGTGDPLPSTIPAARDNSPGHIFSDAESEWNRRMTGLDRDDGRSLPNPRAPEPTPTLRGVLGGDRPLNWRQSILAIAVPAAAYRQHRGNASALLAASVWSDIETQGYARERRVKTSASPEALVRRFHARGHGLPDYLPVCAATAGALRSTHDAAEADAAPSVSGVDRSGATPAAPAAVRPRFSSSITLVTVPLSITGPDGAAVTGLTSSAFRVFEDDVEQKITRLEDGSVPAHIAVLVDTSGSMRAARDALRESAAAFARAVRRSDRVMAVSIDSRVRVLTEFTSDAAAIQHAFEVIRGAGGTRLYDGLALVALDALDRVDGRKAIVLVTDGVDTQSQLTNADGALAAIESSNTPVFVIRYESPDAGSFLPPGAFGISRWIVPPDGPDQREAARSAADRFLARLATGSGGRLLAARPGANIAEMLAHIGDELSRQVVLGYYPSNETLDGRYRRLRVEAQCDGCTVRARAGYRAGAAR